MTLAAMTPSPSSPTRLLESLLSSLPLDHLAACLRLLVDTMIDVLFAAAASRRVSRPPPPPSEPLLTLSAKQLARLIRTCKIKSERLVRSCERHAAECRDSLGAAASATCADAALDEARRVDRIVTSIRACSQAALDELESDTPLLGVPFSVRDGIRVKGMLHSYGLSRLQSQLAPSDADAVRSLREAGAIPLFVSNAAELGVWWETTNAGIGVTNNPYDTRRTAGGVSGGEAALQASACVSISLASESAISAAFCGVFGHKPTPGLISARGSDIVDPQPGFTPTLQCLGPLSRHAEDLSLVLKVLVGREKAALLRLDKQVFLTRIRFFYLSTGIGGAATVSMVSAEVKQSLFRVVDFLEDHLGVTVTPLDLRGASRAVSLYAQASARERRCFGTKTSGLWQRMRGDDNKGKSLLQQWLRWILGRGEYVFPCLLGASLERLRGLFFRRSKKVGVQMWGDDDIAAAKCELEAVLRDDGVLLCPPHPTVAPFHCQPLAKPFNFLYSGIFSVLGLPVTSVPVGLSREGMPLGIQVVASSYHDRLPLAVAEALERPFGGWTPPFRQHFCYLSALAMKAIQSVHSLSKLSTFESIVIVTHS